MSCRPPRPFVAPHVRISLRPVSYLVPSDTVARDCLCSDIPTGPTSSIVLARIVDSLAWVVRHLPSVVVSVLASPSYVPVSRACLQRFVVAVRYFNWSVRYRATFFTLVVPMVHGVFSVFGVGCVRLFLVGPRVVVVVYRYALAVARPCLVASCRSRIQRSVRSQILGLRLAHWSPLSLDAPRCAPFVRLRRILLVAPGFRLSRPSLPSVIAPPRLICALCSWSVRCSATPFVLVDLMVHGAFRVFCFMSPPDSVSRARLYRQLSLLLV